MSYHLHISICRAGHQVHLGTQINTHSPYTKLLPPTFNPGLRQSVSLTSSKTGQLMLSINSYLLRNKYTTKFLPLRAGPAHALRSSSQPGIFHPCPFRLTSLLISSPSHSPSVRSLDTSGFCIANETNNSQSILGKRPLLPRPNRYSRIHSKPKNKTTTQIKTQKWQEIDKKETRGCK